MLLICLELLTGGSKGNIEDILAGFATEKFEMKEGKHRNLFYLV